MLKHTNEDTIVALSTPIGEGGIGIVRISGSDALKIADRIFVRKDGKLPSGFKTYTVHYGVIIDTNHESRLRPYGPIGPEGTTNHVIDEVLLTVMLAPRTYTKEDIVEINCHGGIQAAKNVLELTG